MCEIKDLMVLVVEPDERELDRTCLSLNSIGVTRILCVHTYEEAVTALRANPDVDIVLADFDIESGQNLGVILCDYLKKTIPGVPFILTSKDYKGSVVLESIKGGAADIFDMKREGEIEQLLQKWLDLAKQRILTREELYGAQQRGAE